MNIDDIKTQLGATRVASIERQAQAVGAHDVFERAAEFGETRFPDQPEAALALASVKAQQLAGLPANKESAERIDSILNPPPAVEEPAAEAVEEPAPKRGRKAPADPVQPAPEAAAPAA